MNHLFQHIQGHLYGAFRPRLLPTGGAAFSPLSLFANSEEGLWFDPSDFSSMFQDSTGTTPVTAVEQPVGLILDKRLGLVLGAEIITNGDFSDGTTGWYIAPDWSLVDGALVAAGAAAACFPFGVNSVVGVTYLVTIDVSVGSLNVFLGGQYAPQAAPGTFTARFTATNTNGISFSTAAGATIDNISVREIAGNHASQPTAAARPVVSARVNLWEQTEDFDNVYWTKTRSSISANSAVAPDGTITADKLVEDSTASDTHLVLRAFAANSPATVYTLSVYAKAAERSAIWLTHANFTDIMFDLASGTCDAGGVIQNVGNGWFRCSVAATAPDTVSRGYAYRLGVPGQSYTGDGSSGVYLWRPQLELGSTATRYQRVTTASDYDAVGFPHYLAIDGVDDRLDISSLSLIDGMDCFIAVNTNSGVTNQALFTLDVGYSAYFGIWSSGSYAVTYGGAVGTPEVAVDGTVLPSALRNDLYGALTVGDWHILEYRGLDLSTWTTMLLFGGGHIPFSGDVGGIVLCPSQDEATRAKVRQYLGNKVGLSL